MFDMMIMDEAKTPFYEFIIPMYLGKKWIISGDPKQLAPFVDPTHIIHSLKNVIEEFNIDKLMLHLNMLILNNRKFEKKQIISVIENKDFGLIRSLTSKFYDSTIMENILLIDNRDGLSNYELDKMLNNHMIIITNHKFFKKYGENFPADVILCLDNIESERIYQ